MCPVCRMLLYYLVAILFPHINDDARSKSHQIYVPLSNKLQSVSIERKMSHSTSGSLRPS